MGKRFLTLAVAGCLAASGVCTVVLQTPDTAQAATGAHKSGWSRHGKTVKYYKNGSAVTGLKKIGKHRYFFNKKGVMKRGTTNVGAATLYLKQNGRLEAARVGKKYYYSNLKRMTSADANCYKTYVRAQKILKKITKKSDSKATKRYKAFRWVMLKYYADHKPFDPAEKGWTARYANYHFDNRGGDCVADASAFAYLARAAGYKAYVAVDEPVKENAHNFIHSWCMIDGKAYDPLFAQAHHDMSTYYGGSGGYEKYGKWKYAVPGISAKHAKKSAKQNKTLLNLGKNGLVKAGGAYYYLTNGKRAKNAWKTVAGARYWFKGNGEAATGPCKVKGVWYVFGKDGKLQQPKTSGEVKVDGKVYRVSSKGRALAGLDDATGHYYLANGELVVGVCFRGGKFYAAAEDGHYDEALTGQLRKAAVRGTRASELRALLGTPVSESYVASCNKELGNGDDGIWRYDGFTVDTFTPEGSEHGSDAETVWTVMEN